MARRPRLVVPGQLHHTLLRGHNQQPVFADAQDRQAFLDALMQAAAAHSVQLHGYGLQPNQVQLLATPPDSTALSRMMQALGRRYVRLYNQRHHRSGTLWEGRFHAALVAAGTEALRSLRYIELGAEPHGLALGLLDAGLSSLTHHLGQTRDPRIVDLAMYWKLGNTPFERQAAYQRWLAEGVTAVEQAHISDAIAHDRALAAPEQVARWAAELQRPLTRLPRGRPRKAVAAQ